MECSSPPGDMSTLPTCLMCSDLALWCPTHCTEIERQSTLCRYHFDSTADECMYGYSSGSDGSRNLSLSWVSCSAEGCQRMVHACSVCRS
eukprot:5840842-Karenia_brevis.AAC.1